MFQIRIAYQHPEAAGQIEVEPGVELVEEGQLLRLHEMEEAG